MLGQSQKLWSRLWPIWGHWSDRRLLSHLLAASLPVPDKLGQRTGEFRLPRKRAGGEGALPAQLEPLGELARSPSARGAAAAAELRAATLRPSGLSLAPGAVLRAPALGSPALTGLRESRARAGGGGERRWLHLRPASSSRAVPKAPPAGKVHARRSRRTRALSTGAGLCTARCSGGVLLRQGLFYSLVPSLFSPPPPVVHVQPRWARGGAGRGEGDLVGWALGRWWDTGSPGVPGWPQIYRAPEMHSGEGQEVLKPELDLKVGA